MMRGLKKMVMGVVVGALMLALTAGVALAVNGNYVNCGSFVHNPLTPECYGTPQRDGIAGRNAEDIIYAKDGDDFAYAHSGNDEVYGSAGRDQLHGQEGGDELSGGDNADHLLDGIGDDRDVLRGVGTTIPSTPTTPTSKTPSYVALATTTPLSSKRVPNLAWIRWTPVARTGWQRNRVAS